MTKRLRLIQMLDDRALEMHSNHATHCAFTRYEVALMLDQARGLKVQLDNALSSCEAVREDLRREQAECFKRREERDAAVKLAEQRLQRIAELLDEQMVSRAALETATKELDAAKQEYWRKESERVAATNKPDFVKICRDQLDTCLRDGSWIGYAELRDYVTHTATYGEQDQ